jgi:hypothetical protein
MGFLPHEISENCEEMKLLLDFWDILEGGQTNGIKIENILSMLLLVRGVQIASKNANAVQNNTSVDQEGNL